MSNGDSTGRRVNEMTTDEASANADASDDLPAEYHLDYAQSRPNRFASRMSGKLSYSGMQEGKTVGRLTCNFASGSAQPRAGEGDEGER